MTRVAKISVLDEIDAGGEAYVRVTGSVVKTKAFTTKTQEMIDRWNGKALIGDHLFADNQLTICTKNPELIEQQLREVLKECKCRVRENQQEVPVKKLTRETTLPGHTQQVMQAAW